MWFVFLLLIATAVAFPSTTTITTTIIYDSALGYYCDADTNCGGLVGNSMCLNNICVCRPGYVAQGIMSCV